MTQASDETSLALFVLRSLWRSSVAWLLRKRFEPGALWQEPTLSMKGQGISSLSLNLPMSGIMEATTPSF